MIGTVRSAAKIEVRAVSTLGTSARGEPLTLAKIDCWTAARHYIFVTYAYDTLLDASKLKETLERALAAYYPATGRLSERTDGGLVIGAIGKGAPFVEATCVARRSAADTFSHGRPEMVGIEALEYVPPAIAGDEAPLITAQLTAFSEGGCVLGLCFHHCLTDANGFFQFMGYWSGLYRGETPSFVPVHSRIAAMTTGPSGEHAEYLTCAISPERLPVPPASHARTFHFAPDLLGRLKKEADAYSTNDALGAYLWQNVTRARAQPDATGPISYGYTVDMRGRLDEARIPKDRYFGNGIGLGQATVSSVATLLGMELKAISKVIRASVDKYGDPRHLESVLALAHEHADIRTLVPSINPVFGFDLFVSSWAKFPTYGSGTFENRPVYAGPSPSSLAYGGCAVLTADSDGGINALVCLPPDQMERLNELLRTD